MSNVRDLWYDWLGMNTWLFKQINSLSDLPIYGSTIKLITYFGDKKLLSYMLVAIAVFAISSIIVRITLKKGGTKSYIFTWLTIVLMIATGLFTTSYTNDYIKNKAAYPRPYAILNANDVKLLEVLPAEEAYKSFPSGHVTLITILVFALWPVLSENFRWAGILLIFSVAWSRIAVGVHFPMDVISGFAIAFIQMMLIHYILYGIVRNIRLALKI
jgi:membrane-associated phospholipid phosphatase